MTEMTQKSRPTGADATAEASSANSDPVVLREAFGEHDGTIVSGRYVCHVTDSEVQFVCRDQKPEAGGGLPHTMLTVEAKLIQQRTRPGELPGLADFFGIDPTNRDEFPERLSLLGLDRLNGLREPLIAAGANTLPFVYVAGDQPDGSLSLVQIGEAWRADSLAFSTDSVWLTHDVFGHAAGLARMPQRTMRFVQGMERQAEALSENGEPELARVLMVASATAIGQCSELVAIGDEETPVRWAAQMILRSESPSCVQILEEELRVAGLLEAGEHLTADSSELLKRISATEREWEAPILEVLRRPPQLAAAA